MRVHSTAAAAASKCRGMPLQRVPASISRRPCAWSCLDTATSRDLWKRLNTSAAELRASGVYPSEMDARRSGNVRVTTKTASSAENLPGGVSSAVQPPKLDPRNIAELFCSTWAANNSGSWAWSQVGARARQWVPERYCSTLAYQSWGSNVQFRSSILQFKKLSWCGIKMSGGQPQTS